jgi:LPS-assembly lipoprotein
MSSSDRRAFLTLIAAAPFAACGFTPAFGPGGPAAGLLGRVAVDAPADKDAFDLVARLEERLGRTRVPDLRLSYRITTKTQAQAIAPDNTINRYQVFGTVEFALHEMATDAVLTSGKVTSFTAYSAFGTSVATAVSEADARTRLMRILADEIVTRLIATAAAWNRR